jgi:hypothetical protein
MHKRHSNLKYDAAIEAFFYLQTPDRKTTDRKTAPTLQSVLRLCLNSTAGPIYNLILYIPRDILTLFS